MARIVRVTLNLAIVFVMACSVCGCLIATKTTAISPEIKSLFEGTYTTDPFMEDHRPLTVAVLPFLNKSDNKEGSMQVRRGFYNHFSSLPFRDMELQRVDNLLAKANLTDPAAIDAATPQELGKILNVDAVIYGEISNFDKLFAVMYSQVAVGAEIKMFDTQTGHILWSGQHTVRIHEGGLSVSPVGIIATVVATSMNVRDIQLLRACDDLFRDMVKTIPVPTAAEALKPPTIALLTQDTKNLPKKAGDEIKVVIQGTPGKQAYFDIGEFKRHIDMQEQEAGWYLGTYKVLPGDNVSQALLTGYLADDTGNASSWVDALGMITIDTAAPDKLWNVQVVGRNNLILLNWDASPVTDLSGYRIYRSSTPLTGFQEAGTSELTEWRDETVKNGQNYYYYVTACDWAGNESEKTDILPGMPVAPGPTPVAGSIGTDSTWYAGASPYIIENPVIVLDKATLTIEPGTAIQSRGGSLTIEGTIRARGTENNLITFAAAEEGKLWDGIIFKDTKEKDHNLAKLKISGATAAITCESSSPRLEDMELVNNGRALIITGAFSHPELRENTIHKNREGAVLITSGAKPLFAANRVTDNLKEGIIIDAAAPVIQGNQVRRNQGGGISVHNSNADISGNGIVDNKPWEMLADDGGTPVKALDNWWGSVRGIDILSRIRGRIDISQILDGEPPTGKSLALPIMGSLLEGDITKDSYLTLANSPYRITADVRIDGGAVLTIEPGVTVLYEQGRAIDVEDGGIIARGTVDRPIVFTAAAESPLPGSYAAAIRFNRETQVASVFNYCIIRYAETALDIHFGKPEISNCIIAHNSQSGVFCRNDASPKISRTAFLDNRGEGAVRSVGMSKPVLSHNNFIGNVFAVQAFSSVCLDARDNWWGTAPPDESSILKTGEDSIRIEPWLDKPEEIDLKE